MRLVVEVLTGEGQHEMGLEQVANLDECLVVERLAQVDACHGSADASAERTDDKSGRH
jgi:hypothetical protein